MAWHVLFPDYSDTLPATAQYPVAALMEIRMTIHTMIITLASVALLSSTAALAQKAAQPADSHAVINRMAKDLGLNDTQRSQVETILNNEKKKVEAVFNEERVKLQAIQEETRASLQAVLTPEQMQKLDRNMRQKSSSGKK